MHTKSGNIIILSSLVLAMWERLRNGRRKWSYKWKYCVTWFSGYSDKYKVVMNCTHHRQAGSGEIVSIYHRIHNFGITFRNIINTGWKLKFSLKDVWCFAQFGTMSFIIKLEKVLATVNKAKHLSSVNHTTKTTHHHHASEWKFLIS